MKQTKNYCIDCKKEISIWGTRCLSCARKGNNHPFYGKKHSKQTKLKLSELNTGNKHPQFGKPKSIKTKLKISKALTGIIRSEEYKEKQRKSSVNYIDGRVSKLKIWRESVKKRDNYTCQICGKTKNETQYIDSHHIKSKIKYPELIYDINNGMTLCRSCHRRIEPNRILKEQ